MTRAVTEIEALDGGRYSVSDGAHLVVVHVAPTGVVKTYDRDGVPRSPAQGLALWPALFTTDGVRWFLTDVGRSLFAGARREET